MVTTTDTAHGAATDDLASVDPAFIADRQKFWGTFTSAVTGGAIAVVVLLLGMLIFLV